MKKIFLTREEVNISNWWYKIMTTPASIYQHFNLTAHSLKKAIRVWSFATGEFYVTIVYLYTRSHEYEKFLIILESVKFETETISPTVRSLNSDSGKVLFTTLEFCFTIKIRSFTFVSCMISTIIPRYFQTVVQILFSAHINNSESDKSF